MIVFRGKVNFSVNLLILPCFTVLFFLGQIEKFILFYFCAVLHETAHMITAVIFGIKVKELELLPFGLCVKIEDSWEASCFKEIMLYLSGPLLNILLAIIGITIGVLFPGVLPLFSKNFTEINIFLALFNLIPMFPLDGSRILMGILSLRSGIIKSAFFVLALSKILAVIFLVFSFLVFIIYNNFLLILLCCYIVWILFNCKESLVSEALLTILSKSKNLKGKACKCKHILVSNDTFLIDLIKEIDRTRVLNAKVYDEHGIYFGLIEERQLITYMIRNNEFLTAGDVVKITIDKN